MTTGMPRPLFDELWCALQWSEQTKEIPEGMPHVEHWWILLDDMIEIFNRHREEYIYRPSGYVWKNIYRACMDLVLDG